MCKKLFIETPQHLREYFCKKNNLIRILGGESSVVARKRDSTHSTVITRVRFCIYKRIGCADPIRLVWNYIFKQYTFLCYFIYRNMISMCFCFIRSIQKKILIILQKRKAAAQKANLNPKNHIIFNFLT